MIHYIPVNLSDSFEMGLFGRNFNQHLPYSVDAEADLFIKRGHFADTKSFRFRLR